MKSKKNNSLSILIAEDSRTQAEQLSFLLEQHGYRVTVAADGKQALLAAQAQKPALIISDIVMPEMNGYELCKAIKSDEALKDIPVILVTTLSDVLDIMKGLECGADNFIRKPYDEKYLLARVDYLLMNQEMRKSQKMQMGMEIHLGGQRHFITAERQQIVDLLISVYEEAIHLNEELKVKQSELADSNRALTGLYHVAEGLNHAVSEREVCERALEHVVEIPGVRAGWISLREGESGFRLGAARNLPPALQVPGAMEGLCECRRRLLAGKLYHVTNILECERLGNAKEDTQGLRYHASVPLWNGDQTLGVMNLVGTEQGLFREDELETLYGVGHQVGIALERARLHEHLEQLVEERTAALTAEVAERKRIQEEQARLVAIIEATPDFVATGDLDGHALYVNQAGLRMLGYEQGQDVSGLRVGGGQPDWALKLVQETGIPHAIEHGTWSGETAFMRLDGSEIPVLQVIIAHKRPDGSVEYLSTIARDITLRKASEVRISRLNRIYSVLSGINTTIVRVREEGKLFSEACRIAVEHGGFVFAWIGKFDAGSQQVTPLARAGRDDGYLAQINLTSHKDTPGNCALTAQALNEAKPVICNNIASDERMAALRSEALSRGYRSVVVLPLMQESKPVGVFVLYAAETGVFDEEEMKLLVEMSGDISFALENFRLETRRKQAEDELRKLSLAVEQSPNSIVITDLDANLEYVNEAFVKATGYSRAEAIGRNPSIQHSGKNSRETYNDMWAHLTRGDMWKGELINRRKDGSEYVESILISPVRDNSGHVTHYLGISEDITERKLAASKLAEQIEELRRWHEATLGREMRTIELKREVNELLVQAGQPPRYPSAEASE